MTVLVTGAGGGLGRNAVEHLASRGTSVRATVRDPLQGETLRRQGIPCVAADLGALTPETAAALLDGVDAVWHCAARSSPWGDYPRFYADNVRAAELLAGHAAARRVRRFVHVSTPSIYFDYRHRLDIDESHRAARFANHYAQTKALAEDRIRELAARHPDTTFVILRPRALFGPYDRVLLPRLLHLLDRRGGELPLPRGGEALMDLTYVGNVVHAMERAGDAPGLPSGEAFNITNQAPVRLKPMLERLLGDALGRRLRIRDLPYPVLDALARGLEVWGRLSGREPAFTRYGMGVLHYDMTLSNGKAQRLLGYHPPYTLDDGIRLTAAAFERHGHDHHL